MQKYGTVVGVVAVRTDEVDAVFFLPHEVAESPDTLLVLDVEPFLCIGSHYKS